jgi:PEGA domain
MSKSSRPPREPSGTPMPARRVTTRSAARRGGLALLLGALLLSTGCVSRTLSVRSDPPGARVTLDGKIVGTTPYDQELQTYGTRSIDLELAGYTSRHELLDLPLPWWQIFPLDIATDLLLPLGLHDDHVFTFALAPLDPEAGTWDDAHAALAKEQAQRAATLRATGAEPVAPPAKGAVTPADHAGSGNADGGSHTP